MQRQTHYSQGDLIELYHQPFFTLIHQAHNIHRQHHDPCNIQKCSLLSIKTGGCPEDCSYCPQSAHYQTKTERHGLLDLEGVRQAAQEARKSGSQRFCMGAAWREVKDGEEFDRVLEMVKTVKEEGLEACVTLGMLTQEQAHRLKEAGLDAYNHNVDTSKDYYQKIISTRTYSDRLQTLKFVRQAGITVCSGGIIGMGESVEDRCTMVWELASMRPQPESVPINLLIPVEGTPLEKAPQVSSFELIRIIALARLSLPSSRIRLSAGRISLNREAQAWAFFAGANSIFLGETLLTRENPQRCEDELMFSELGLGEEASCTP